MKGRVTYVYPEQGYAFIRGDDFITYFAHVREFENADDFSTLRKDQELVFEPFAHPRGPRAVQIRSVPS